MEKKILKIYDVVGEAPQREISSDRIPSDGDPLQIDGEMYFVCERNLDRPDGPEIGVIPLVVRNPSRISNIKHYIDCLSMAHRKVLFRNSQGISGLEDSEEMIVT